MIPNTDSRIHEARRRLSRLHRRRLMTARDRSPVFMVSMVYNEMRRSVRLIYRAVNSRGEPRDWPEDQPYPNINDLLPLSARPASPPSLRPASPPSPRPASPPSPRPAPPSSAHLLPSLPDDRPPNAPPLAVHDMRPPSWNHYYHGPARVRYTVYLYPDGPVRPCTMCGLYCLHSWWIHATRPHPHGNRRRRGPVGNQ